MTSITHNESKRWPLARVLSVLTLLAGMMLGWMPGGKAAGIPKERPGAYRPPYVIVFTPINNNAVAGSGVEDQVKVTVIDQATGNPVPNFPIAIKFDTNISTDNEVTDGTGSYIVRLSGDEVGSTDVHITVNGAKSTYTFNYVAGTPSNGPSSNTQLIVDVPVAPDDGATPTTIHAHVENQFGANFPGLPVTFTIFGGTASGTAVVTVVNGVTDGAGNATINITNLRTGTVTFTATYVFLGVTYQITNNSPATVTFVARPDPGNPATALIVDVPTAPADNATTTTLHAHVMGDDGLPLAGSKVVFTITGGTASGTATTTVIGTGYTDANGDVYMDVINSKPGTVTFTATAQDLLNTNLYQITNGSPATVTFTSITPDVNNPATALIVDVPTAPADNSTPTKVHAHIVGDDGLPMANATVVFTISGGTAAGTAGVTVIGTGKTDANGDVYIDVINSQLGTVDFTATVQYGAGPVLSIINGSPATVNFIQPPPNIAQSYIVGVTTSTLADGTSQNEVDAVIVNGTPFVAGIQVTFTIKVGTATITTTGITDGSGTVKAYFTSGVVGSVDVQASVDISGVPTFLNDANAPSNNYTTIQFIAGPPVPGEPGGGGTGGTPPGNGGNPPSGGSGTGGNNNGPGDNNNFTVLFVRQDFRLADGTQQDSVIAFVTDANHHPLKNVAIQFIIQTAPGTGTATSGAQFTIDPTSVLTDDQGMARIALTSTKSGTVYVNAVLIVDGVLIDGSYQIVTFTTKPDVKNPLTNLSVVIYEALADGVQQTVVKAHVVDLDGVIMAGQEVVFKIDSGDATIVTPAPVYTDANGDAFIYITSTKPGFALITATVGGESITFGSPARVKFAPINIYVPKVFTPNNDGTNDLLKPILVGITEFHYWSIYNRWGNLIYTSQDPNRGWDGTFKGVAQPVETYVWIAEGVDVNGKKIVQKGMTSLVR
ncbi:MAG: Ig-like domain-containing protein [Bacteroidetes bacterium]|nr:Ig-like domain-containing protein [Bacteroidota bacterium]